MKATLLFLLLLICGAGPVAQGQTPIDTTGGRYYRPIFPSVTVMPGVVYGSAVTFSGATQQLLMDVYQPAGDVAPERPVIIFAHQGGFVAGSRTEQYMVDVCTRFAKLGYVTASIDYRLFFFPFDTVNVAKAAIRGMQDMRAAVRFFRQDAATANLYRVSPSRIIVGGASAGGFMALQVGYLDKESEVPAYVGINSLGGIEGNSGNPGYSSAVLAVLNLSGATERASYIEPGDVPLYSIHGTADAVVPYLQGRVGTGLPPKYVVGSGRLHPRATAIGVPNRLRTLRGAPHIPMYGSSPAQLAYADTTFRDIRDFLRPLLVPVTAAYPSLIITSPTNVPGGAYQDITINSSQAQLTGNITVYGSLTIRSLAGQVPGALQTSCFTVDGPGSFALQAGAMLRICSPDGIAASGAAGAIRNTGTRTFSPDAVYAYEGSTDQITGTGLPAQVRELELALPAANRLTLTNNLSIRQRLLPISGMLDNSARSLTLLSDPAGTALVAPGAGSLTSAFTVQRYIDPSVNPGLGYRHLAPPLDGLTTASLATASYTPVLNPAYNASSRPDLVRPFPTVFDYAQERTATSPAISYSNFDKGWLVPVSAGGGPAPLVRGQGYAVNMPGGETLAFTGPLSRNNEDISVTLSAAVSPAAGWHLLGNPFPSALNWDNVTVPASMSRAMYIFVSTGQYAGQYRTYVNGMGSASTVPLGQGFFVRSLAASPVTITFPASARISDFAAANAATVQRPAADVRPRLRLTLAGASSPAAFDEALLYQETGATAGVDAPFDATKLPNPNGLNLASVAVGEELAINGLPLLLPARVPLALTVPRPGAYVLTAAELRHFAPGTAIILTDTHTGSRTALAAGTSYRFAVAGTAAPGRFLLELSPAQLTSTAQALSAQLLVYPNPATGAFQVELPTASNTNSIGAATLWLTNALGQTVRRQELTASGRQPLTAQIAVQGLAPGVYQLHLQVGGTTLVRRVLLR